MPSSEGGSDDNSLLVVTCQYNETTQKYVADHTFAEVFGAIQQGKTVVFRKISVGLEYDCYESFAMFAELSNTWPGARELCFSGLYFYGTGRSVAYCYLMKEETVNVVEFKTGIVTATFE